MCERGHVQWHIHGVNSPPLLNKSFLTISRGDDLSNAFYFLSTLDTSNKKGPNV